MKQTSQILVGAPEGVRATMTGTGTAMRALRITFLWAFMHLAAICAAAAQADTLFVGISGTTAAVNKIVKIAADGSSTLFASDLNAPGGLAWDRSGNLLVVNNGDNTILRFTPDGTRTILVNSGLNGPGGLAVDGNGNLYVGNWGNKTITRITADGTPSFFANLAGNPGGLACDSHGNLYAAIYANVQAGRDIVKFTPDGTSTIFATGMNYPFGLAFDSLGNLFVSNDYGNNSIIKVAPDGTRTVFATGLSRPAGLAVDSSDNLYVANNTVVHDSGTIIKFAPDGTRTTFATGLDGPIYIAFAPVVAETRPTIQAQPANQVGYWGKDVSFTVRASGSVPLSFQWFKDTSVIPWATNSLGGTNSTLTLTNLELSASGEYWVSVSNAYGTTNSVHAKLEVNPSGVSLGLYAGVTIDGVVGRAYAVQSTSDINSPDWTTAATITLTNAVQLWTDSSVDVSTGTKRFYRVIPAAP